MYKPLGFPLLNVIQIYPKSFGQISNSKDFCKMDHKLCAILVIFGLCSSVRTVSKEDDIEELRETIRALQVTTNYTV